MAVVDDYEEGGTRMNLDVCCCCDAGTLDGVVRVS